MKKTVMMLVICCLILSCTSIEAMATDTLAVNSANAEVLLPRLTLTDHYRSELTISSQGAAKITCELQGQKSVTNSVKITANLQQCKNGEWITIKTYTIEKTSYYASLIKIYNVAKGYSYRLQTVFKVYSDSAIETIPVTSKVYSI